LEVSCKTDNSTLKIDKWILRNWEILLILEIKFGILLEVSCKADNSTLKLGKNKF
jgi:hypothetical protein